MNEKEKRKLFHLLMQFNKEKNQTFSFARHIWLSFHKLNDLPPAHVMEIFTKQLKKDDEIWQEKRETSIQKILENVDNEMQMFDFILDHQKTHNSSKTDAIEAYRSKLEAEANGAEINFETIKQQYYRLENKMDEAVKKYGD